MPHLRRSWQSQPDSLQGTERSRGSFGLMQSDDANDGVDGREPHENTGSNGCALGAWGVRPGLLCRHTQQWFARARSGTVDTVTKATLPVSHLAALDGR